MAGRFPAERIQVICMSLDVTPEMLEDLKNEVIIPYIEKKVQFPCVYSHFASRDWQEAYEPEEMADTLVEWMAQHNWKGEVRAIASIKTTSWYPFSEGGAIDSLLDAYGGESGRSAAILDQLVELDWRGVSFWWDTYDNNTDIIEVINTSPDIEEELPVIVRLLGGLGVARFYSAMEAYRAGTPLEDLVD